MPPGVILDPERWVDEHGDHLYRYALVQVRNTAVAQDLVQDTLLAALRSREEFAGRSSERTWLRGILRNKVIDRYRKLSREISFTDLDFLTGEFSEKFIRGSWIHADAPRHWKPEPEVVVHRAEFWVVLRHCLGKLPDRLAQAFMLREMEEIPAPEICRILLIKESNLWVMLHRARLGLRECLEIHWFNKGAGDASQ